MVEFNKPNNCIKCNNDDFTFVNSMLIFNPETSEEEIEKNIYKCNCCNTLYFIDKHDNNCVQLEVNTNEEARKTRFLTENSYEDS